MSIQLQPRMLEFGAQGHVFKNVTKRLCTIYWTIKSLTLSSKNTETGYQNLIHKQAIWVTFCRWNVTFLRTKWEKWSRVVSGGNFEDVTKWEKKLNFQIKLQCCWLSFILVESFCFLQEFNILYELRFTIFSQKKIPRNKKKSLWLLQKLVTLFNLGYL